MNLDLYLERVGFQSNPKPDLATLRALHRAHLLSIPYENLDIHLGHKLTLELPHIFDKLVTEKRGGWCFEMNGLFAWVLEQIGFEVTLLSAVVNQHLAGDKAEGNHLTLLVELDKPYLVDVGFGDGPLEPLSLREGLHEQNGLEYRLKLAKNRWTFHHHQYGAAERFDFTLDEVELGTFSDACQNLQASPESGFVEVTVCQLFTPNGLLSLRGAVLNRITATGKQERAIRSADEYTYVLAQDFGLAVDAYHLWPQVWRGHLEWLRKSGI